MSSIHDLVKEKTGVDLVVGRNHIEGLPFDVSNESDAETIYCTAVDLQAKRDLADLLLDKGFNVFSDGGSDFHVEVA